MPRPATGKTPKRSIRVEDAIWLSAKAKAESEGKTITDVVKAFLRGYVAGSPPPGQQAEEDERAESDAGPS